VTLPAPARAAFDELVRRLTEEGRPFALATVVRTVDATSAKPGARAVVLEDGALAAGWVGGGCARAALAAAAAAAIASGRPQFLSLRPGDLLDAEGVRAGEERAGVRFAESRCPSHGSMDIFVEPVLPQPRLVILGAGPVALALADLADRFDLHRTLAAPGLDPGSAPAVEALQAGFAIDTGGTAERFVVVATQGRGDEAALRAALASGAARIAFVGSRAKFAALSQRLQSDGIAAGRLAAVAAPAGLDIHAITPEEIALSILAQIIGWRRAGRRDGAQP
jgi:xanthine dehydrogenase accessory factor